MLLVGLTGGIGSGKSTIAKIFAICGIPVLDTDQLSKDIVQADPEVQAQITTLFGKECFVNGKLQNKVLASKAFASVEQSQKLNAIIHPKVFTATEQWILAQRNVPYVIKESALLIESNAHLKCDFVIQVKADLDLRIQRVMKRSALTPEEILNRVNKQISDKEREKHSHFTILNNGNDYLIQQVVAIHQLIMNKVKA